MIAFSASALYVKAKRKKKDEQEWQMGGREGRGRESRPI